MKIAPAGQDELKGIFGKHFLTIQRISGKLSSLLCLTMNNDIQRDKKEIANFLKIIFLLSYKVWIRG